MTFDMVCSCGAAFHMTIDDMEDKMWVMLNRFNNAHVSCGFMTSTSADKSETTKSMNIKMKDA